jgi:hypothetical protein
MRALACGGLAVGLLVLAGCGGGNGLGRRSETVYEVLHESLGSFETDIPATGSDRVVYDVVALPFPQRRVMHVVVWRDWAGLNRMLTGNATSGVRPVGYCRQVGVRRPVRVCVVGDRITASGLQKLVARLRAMIRTDTPR